MAEERESLNRWPDRMLSRLHFYSGVLIRLAALLLSVCVSPAVPSSAAEAWQSPASPFRATFTVSETADDNLLVMTPVAVSNAGQCCAFLQDGTPLQGALVSTGAGKAAYIVARGSSDWARKRVSLYFGGATGAPAAVAKSATPVAVEARRVGAKAIPSAWPRMLYLFNRASKGDRSASCQSFSPLAMPVMNDDKKKESRWVVRLRSYFACPTNMVCRFALDCKDAGYLLVDKELVAASPGEHAAGRWAIGDLTNLNAGVHSLELFNTCGDRLEAKVGFCGTGNPEDVVRISPEMLLSSEQATEVRIEGRDSRMDVDFTYEMAAPSHKLRDMPNVLVPVRFKNSTAEKELAGKVDYRWFFGDGSDAAVRETNHLYSSTGRFTVRLEGRAGQGVVESCEKIVDCRYLTPKEYPLGFEIVDLPAVCFPRDKIMPRFRIDGTLPVGREVTVSWNLTRKDGSATNAVRRIVPETNARFIPFASGDAGGYDSIQWHLSLDGQEAGDGLVRFLTAPFAELPDSVAGDRLYSKDGSRLVLIPQRLAGRLEQPEFEPDGKTMVFVDDQLLPQGVSAIPEEERYYAIVGAGLKSRGCSTKYVRIKDWAEIHDASADLCKLVDIPREASDAGTVLILSIGLLDMAGNRDPAVFERSAAALTDIVSCTMKRPVVWVTPPPYLDEHGLVRKYAAAIKRVADAKRVPVADLYTAFMTSEGGFKSLTGTDGLLNAEGHKLVAGIILRTLQGKDVEDE